LLHVLVPVLHAVLPLPVRHLLVSVCLCIPQRTPPAHPSEGLTGTVESGGGVIPT